jgi:hypothetical protein
MHSSGMGLHADLVPMKDIVMMAKWLVVAEILYAFNLGWTKLSLLLMYYRIFRFPYFKKMAWVVGSFTMAWVVCITFLFIFICVPVQKLWYPELPGHCINQVGTWIANAAATILTDLVILLMPLPQIWRLRLGMREKLGLTAAFCLGFLQVPGPVLSTPHANKCQRRVCLGLPYQRPLHLQRRRSDLYPGPDSGLDCDRNVRRHHLGLPPDLAPRLE